MNKFKIYRNKYNMVDLCEIFLIGIMIGATIMTMVILYF